MTIDLAHAFTYAFEDKQWLVKLGLLLLIGLVPGLDVIAWVGFQISIAHNMARGAANPLPTWDDWADILVRGLMGIAAGFMYFLPILLAGGCAALLGWIGGQRAATTLAVIRCCLVVGVLAYGSFAALALSAASTHYAQTDHYSDYFDWRGRLRSLSGHIGVYLMGFIYQALLTIFVLALTPLSIVTLVGPVVILTAYSVVNGYLLGSVAKQVR